MITEFPKTLVLNCSSEQFNTYRRDFFKLHCYLQLLFSPEQINSYTHLKLKLGDDSDTFWISDIRDDSLNKRRLHMLNTSPNGLLYPAPYVKNCDWPTLINSINMEEKKALVLTRKDSGQVIAASKAYCSFTQPLHNWLSDRRNNKRWDQTMLASLYDDYLDNDPDGVVTSGYQYMADHCQNEEAGPIQWVSDFQQIFGQKEERFRICRVRSVEGIWDDH